MRTTKPEGPGALTIIQMSDPEIHLCLADKVAPLHCIACNALMQKFRMQVAKRMKEDFSSGQRFGMGNVYWNIV